MFQRAATKAYVFDIERALLSLLNGIEGVQNIKNISDLEAGIPIVSFDFVSSEAPHIQTNSCMVSYSEDGQGNNKNFDLTRHQNSFIEAWVHGNATSLPEELVKSLKAKLPQGIYCLQPDERGGDWLYFINISRDDLP